MELKRVPETGQAPMLLLGFGPLAPAYKGLWPMLKITTAPIRHKPMPAGGKAHQRREPFDASIELGKPFENSPTGWSSGGAGLSLLQLARSARRRAKGMASW